MLFGGWSFVGELSHVTDGRVPAATSGRKVLRSRTFAHIDASLRTGVRASRTLWMFCFFEGSVYMPQDTPCWARMLGRAWNPKHGYSWVWRFRGSTILTRVAGGSSHPQ